MVKLNLESTGRYNIRIQTDSSKALFEALMFEPDAILLDVIMAKKEGPDVAVDIKKNALLQDIPIIFLTATVTQQEVDDGEGMIGGHAFVAKPSNLNILLNTIEKKLSRYLMIEVVI